MEERQCPARPPHLWTLLSSKKRDFCHLLFLCPHEGPFLPWLVESSSCPFMPSCLQGPVTTSLHPPPPSLDFVTQLPLKGSQVNEGTAVGDRGELSSPWPGETGILKPLEQPKKAPVAVGTSGRSLRVLSALPPRPKPPSLPAEPAQPDVLRRLPPPHPPLLFNAVNNGFINWD